MMIIESLIGNCVARARAISLRAKKIANEEFPNDQPKKLSLAIGKLSEVMAEQLVEYYLNSDSKEKIDIIEHIKKINGLIIFYAEILRFADGAISQKVPWSLVSSLQEFAEKLVPDITIMFRPKWHYNYSIIMDDIVTVLESTVDEETLSAEQLNKCFDNLKKNFYIIAFPYIERKSILLHATVAHEIGHLVVQDFIEQVTIYSMPSNLLNNISDLVIKDIEKKDVEPLFADMEIARRLLICSEYMKRALEEISSDLVGIRMFGPAALFAYESISSNEYPDQSPAFCDNQYPPWRYRIRFCIDELKEMGLCDWNILKSETETLSNEGKYIEIFKSYRDKVEYLIDFVKINTDKKEIEKEPLVKIAYEWLEYELPKIKPLIRDKCKENSVTANCIKFWRESCSLAYDRLYQDLPPNILNDMADNPKPSSFEAIINSAWLYYLAFMDAYPRNKTEIEEFINKRDKFERLTLRAIELSYLQYKYEKYKNERNEK